MLISGGGDDDNGDNGSDDDDDDDAKHISLSDAFLDVDLATACWTGLIIYFGGSVVIVGFSCWTLVHMRLTSDFN